MSYEAFFVCDGCGARIAQPHTAYTFKGVFQIRFGHPYIDSNIVSASPNEDRIELCPRCFEATGIDLILERSHHVCVTERAHAQAEARRKAEESEP